MNTRIRQIAKVQLELFIKNRMVMAIVRECGATRVVFIRVDEIEEYRRRYGENITIWR